MSLLWVLIGFATGAGTGVVMAVMYLRDMHRDVRAERLARRVNERQARRDGYINEPYESDYRRDTDLRRMP